MNIRNITSMAAALCICAAMAGCGNTNGSSDQAAEKTAETTIAAETDAFAGTEYEEDAPIAEADHAESTEAPAGLEFSPTDEIINADLASGYIQIGDDIFREGGYMTVGEFIAQYGEKYDCSGIDTSTEAGEEFTRFIEVTRFGTDFTIELVCKAPAAGSGTLADAVIVSFEHEGGIAFENTWLPGGIGNHCADRNYDGMISYMQEKGFTETEDPFPNGGGLSASKMKEHVGTYYGYQDLENITPYGLIQCFVQIDEENLYGVKPVLTYAFSDYMDGDTVYFHPNNYYYGNDSDIYSWG